MSDPIADITAKVAVNIITEIFKSSFNGLKDTKKWITDQNKRGDFFGIAARKYTSKLESLHNTMRIFGMSNPVPLEGIYTRVNILTKLSSSYRITVEELEKRFNRDRGHIGTGVNAVDGITVVNRIKKLVVLGKPGAGKTTFLKYLTLQALDGKVTSRQIPIFVSLKDWADTKLSIFSYIVEQFDICNFPEADLFVDKMLKDGKCLLLLDGFDEVTSDVDDAIRQIRNFVHKYDTNQYVLSCRIAAYSYCFPQFTDIEIADFTPAQIETFVNNWFGQGTLKARRCWEKIKNDAAISELASIPLLLTLLCLAFDENFDFPSNRAELYKDAIDALLKKWDSTRNIKRVETYRDLSPRRKESMFSRIAAANFSEDRYFIPQHTLEKYIVAFISNLLGDKNQAVDIDGEAILKEIEAQHGIFVERAKRIYSFSHLTFQEYFTAKYIVEHAHKGTLKQLVNQYLTNENWREVFLLTTGMLDEADTFLLSMSDGIKQLPKQKELVMLINAIQASAETQTDLALLLPDYGINSVYDRARLFILALKVAQNYLLCHERIGKLPRTFNTSLYSKNNNAFAHAIGLVVELIKVVINDPDFTSTDKSILKSETKIYSKTGAVRHIFSDTRGTIENLNLLSYEYTIVEKSIAVSFLPDISELTKYLVATNLLLSCLQTECYVSNKVRSAIMSDLFK